LASDSQLFDLLHHIKNKLVKYGASDAIVSGVKTAGSQIKFVNNKIAKTETESLVNVGIFFVKDKKVVTTSFREIAKITGDDPFDVAQLNILKKKADKIINKLLLFSKPLQAKQDWRGIADGPFTYRHIEGMYDPKIENLSAEDEIDLVESGMNAAIREGAKRCGGILETAAAESYLVTSGKVEAKQKGTSAYFSIRAMLDKEASGHNTSGARMLRNLDAEKSAKFAGQIAALAKKPIAGQKGTFDVVFAPLAWGSLLDNIAGVTSIFDVEAGVSFFADKLGKKVANPMVNIYDDPTIKNGLGAHAFDAEGVPTQRNALIKNGIFKTYLHNTSTARKYGVKTTASAGLISPGPSNVIFGAGNISKDKLFGHVRKGLYITNVWYTRFQNYATGDFATIPRDGIFLIENGRIKQSLKNIRIKENMIHLLQNVSAIASDAKQMISWEANTPVTTPHVLIKDVTITKPTK